MSIKKLKSPKTRGINVSGEREELLKINEIIDNLNTGLGRPYTVYTALISQVGTDPPTDIILENTTGSDVIWTRTDIGEYDVEFTGLTLDSNKVFITVGWGNGNTDSSITYVNTSTKIHLSMYQNGVLIDEELNKTPFEVRIYP